MPKTAVIILIWNGMKYLPDCLGSIINQDYPKDSREFIIVDNASNDGAAEYVKKNYPEFTVIENDRNYGFDKGNNIGMKYALDKGYDYIVLLNQDTAVEPNWLSELVKAAESDKKIGGVQSLMLHFNDKEMINSVGNQLHFLGFGFCEGNRKKLGEQELRIKDITYASSASVLYRASVLKEAGCFDEEFFLYHEDTDLSFKIKMAGYRIVIASKSVMFHNYEFSRSIKKYYYMERNRYRILLTYLKLPTLILISPAFVVMECGMWLFALRGGWAKEKLRSCAYILNKKNLADIFKKRRYIQRTRKLNDREFTKNFVGEIMYQEIDNPLLRHIANPIFKIYWALARMIIYW
ncbi:MAG: glycosyltransferase family 2 protein [bacterium]